jgi:hypothetical protein
MTTRYVPESKEHTIDYDKFEMKDLELMPLAAKEFPPESTVSGEYHLSSFMYTYHTPQGEIKAELRLRGPEMRAPGGRRPNVGKDGKPTGTYGVSFKPGKGVEAEKKFMDVIQQIYEKSVEFMYSKAFTDVIDKLLDTMGDGINYKNLKDPKRRWGGLIHPLFYAKKLADVNPDANPTLNVPVRKGAKKTMFLKPFKVCRTCGADVTCRNPDHRKFCVELDDITIQTAGFKGIPVIVFKDIFIGPIHKIRHELETLVVTDTECKEAQTTEGETIDKLEQEGKVDREAYEERLKLLNGDSSKPVVEENSKPELHNSNPEEGMSHGGLETSF